MPEETTTAQPQQEQTAPDAGGFQPITSQAALDEIVKARLTRERAKYAGFEEFKSKASEYDVYKASAEKELETTKAALAAAKSELAALQAKAEREAWNAQVAAESGLPLQLVADFAADTLEELQAKAARNAADRAALPYDPRDRKTYQSAAGATTREQFGRFAEQFFN